MAEYNDSLRTRVFWIVKDNPGIVRTEVRDHLKLPNNVVTPAIRELIKDNIFVEGPERISKTTNKPGRSLYLSEDWQKEADSQNRIFTELDTVEDGDAHG